LFIPCNYGEEFYPDKARAVVPLASYEYEPSHPGYRARTPENDEYDTMAHKASSSEFQGEGYAGDARSDSAGSEDPLAWSTERYRYETTGRIDKLAVTLRQTHIEESSSMTWSEWAWDTDRHQWTKYRIS
jgi:hypothetical protein